MNWIARRLGMSWSRQRGVTYAGNGAEGVRDAIAAKIATLPEQLGKSLTWDQDPRSSFLAGTFKMAT